MKTKTKTNSAVQAFYRSSVFSQTALITNTVYRVHFTGISMISVQHFQAAVSLCHLMPADVTILVTSLELSGCHFYACTPHFPVVTCQSNT